MPSNVDGTGVVETGFSSSAGMKANYLVIPWTYKEYRSIVGPFGGRWRSQVCGRWLLAPKVSTA